MKTFVFATLIAFCLFSQAAAGEDGLGAKWKLMIRKAAAQAKVHIDAAPTASAGGVHVMVPSLSLLDGEGDDPALKLYLKCDSAFAAWGKGQKTSTSTAQSGQSTKERGVSDGGHFLARYKYNGDFVGLIYIARRRDGSSPTLMITFVDHDEFTRESPQGDDDELHQQWEQMLRDAASDAKVFIKQSRTGIFDGTYTYLPQPSLGYRTEGDAALAFYNECKFKFDAWATEDGAEVRIEEDKDLRRKEGENPGPVLQPKTGGVYMTQFLAKNGDYLCLKYRAPREDGSGSEFKAFYVDLSEFKIRPIPPTSEKARSPR